ncbi:MAG TPA: PrsW family intramembrane metalloprotease, partial [Pyrinomonadaceae bacterium]|nr:PrsW family intramembrane metalloprotease [Pyrinomonadaceae bacterium]
MLNNPQMPGLDNPNITPTSIQKSGHLIAIKVVAAIAAILIALLLGLIVFLLIGFETGLVGLMIGLVSATIPVPLYILLVLWVDRYESEPLSMLAIAFFWGALVAVFFALVLNTASGVIVAGLTDDRVGEAFSAGISAPIVEESAKAIILLLFFFLRKDEFDGVVDGIVYAAMAGLGFAMTENIQYY